MTTKYLNKSFLIGLFSLTLFLFCISSAKAITDCKTDADCPSGQSCVDEASVGSKGLGKICWKTTASATPSPTVAPSPAKDATTETAAPIQPTNPTSSASAVPSVSTNALVPCGLNGAADCTLCHLVLGFKNIYDYLLSLLLVATTLVIVVAGVMYMVSSGDKGMLDKAKSALTVALTAMILGLTAWLIINVTLNALGFKNAGSWYNFTCDTTQTQGPTGGTGGGTLPAAGGGVNKTPMPTDGSKISNALQKYANVVYGQGYDCSKYVQAVAADGTGWNPGGTTAEMRKGAIPFDQSQIVNGTVIVSSNGHGGNHAAFYYDGAVYHLANPGDQPKVSKLSNYMGWASSNGNFVMRLPGT